MPNSRWPSLRAEAAVISNLLCSALLCSKPSSVPLYRSLPTAMSQSLDLYTGIADQIRE